MAADYTRQINSLYCASNSAVLHFNFKVSGDFNSKDFSGKRVALGVTGGIAAYKAIEVLEDRFGSQTKAVDTLGKIVKEAKTAANQKRHIPKKVQMQPKTSVEPVELARQVIQRYERYLLELHGCAQASTQTFVGK